MIRATAEQTPLGPLTIFERGGAIVASGFNIDRASMRTQLAALYPDSDVLDVGEIPGMSDAVQAYFAGGVGALDAIPVSQPGTALQQAFWHAMRRVPPGKTISYRELAESAGRPRAIRAAGTTCGKNRVAPFVPCHRIVRSGGNVGHYGYGADTKRWLLGHEAAHA